MYVVCVTSRVKPEHAEEYLKACEENARNTRLEPGCLRFDLLRCIDPPNQFFFYEVYRSEADFKAHQQTAHYFAWRDGVADWFEEPRQGVKYNSLSPEGEENW